MKHLNELHYENHFHQLGSSFASPVIPMPIDNSELISKSYNALALLDIKNTDDVDTELLSLLSLTQQPKACEPVATVYSGHQFGHYNPQLGDGRAMLLGQVRNQHGELWELQIKGAGVTPFSRQGDGRAVLRSSIREYLCSETMAALNIPTTRAAALVNSTTPVYREQQETAATILRIAPSHIRFGHFEYFFHTKQFDQVKTLADFVIEHHYSEYAQLPEDQKYTQWLTEVIKRTATLVAKWQAVGFCHGVLNSDNMSILGLTIDYGPFGFLDGFNPNHICNHSDHTGRYRYNQQINIGLWNLHALAISLSKLINEETLRQCLSEYEPAFLAQFSKLMHRKLGLFESGQDDLIKELLTLMAKESTDYSYLFRQLSYFMQGSDNKLTDCFVDNMAWQRWLNSYQRVWQEQTSSDEEKLQIMLNSNPKFVLRNYLAQWAIDESEKGNHQILNDLLHVLQNPFAENKGFEHFCQLPPEWACKLSVSCSS